MSDGCIILVNSTADLVIDLFFSWSYHLNVRKRPAIKISAAQYLWFVVDDLGNFVSANYTLVVSLLQ